MNWSLYTRGAPDFMSKTLTFSLQALLVRHEAYMVDAERDRLDLSAKIEQLETDKKELEEANSKTIEENRGLLNQLEVLNNTVSESESHIKSLEATLQSTHQELRRLEGLAARTQDLDIQLAALEQEQVVLQNTLVKTQAEERSVIQRWKTAERGLCALQDQLERIEREAREERERHIEVLGRMERQRAVERELDTAAGRLKGAAALTAGNSKNGSSVVSHFVKDILQDNANLQLGIVELREMLMNSNEEVQTLRDQLMIHQPMNEDAGTSSSQATLQAELASKDEPEPKVISQELHIHHHFHSSKKEEIRRTKKKRTPINTAVFVPPRSSQYPGPPIRGGETASTILSQTSVTIPTPATPNSRWSVQSAQLSDFAPSSVPSSPQSIYRSGALFDRGFDIDSSRPTSPGSSIDPMSPQFQPSRHRKRGSEVSTRSFIPPMSFQTHVIREEADNDVEEIQDLQTNTVPSLDEGTTPSESSNPTEPVEERQDEWSTSFQPTLHRSTSHESILSVSGLDIHTLKSRPSQLTITGRGLQPRPSLGSPSSTLSLSTLTSSSTVVARPTLSRQGHNSSAYLRSNIEAVSSSDTHSINSSGSNEESIGKKVGGWVFGRWGMTPAKSSNDLRSASAAQSPTQQLVVTSPVDPLRAFMGRAPGVNQKGPVPGFVKKTEKPPSNVQPDVVDRDALRDILTQADLP
jgi:hypothetical protein